MLYTTSDCHFGHSNIIKYCKRPFKDVEEMDNTLIRRWNEVVSDTDTIYHVGDFSFGAIPDSFRPVGSKSLTEKAFVDSIVRRLNGKKVFIKGNHREPPNTVDAAKVRFEGLNFTLVHEPQKASDAGFWLSQKEWLIHGHEHANNLVEFPFFRRDKHRFNVSVELTDYKPISFSDLVTIIRTPEIVRLSIKETV